LAQAISAQEHSSWWKEKNLPDRSNGSGRTQANQAWFDCLLCMLLFRDFNGGVHGSRSLLCSGRKALLLHWISRLWLWWLLSLWIHRLLDRRARYLRNRFKTILPVHRMPMSSWCRHWIWMLWARVLSLFWRQTKRQTRRQTRTTRNTRIRTEGDLLAKQGMQRTTFLLKNALSWSFQFWKQTGMQRRTFLLTTACETVQEWCFWGHYYFSIGVHWAWEVEVAQVMKCKRWDSHPWHEQQWLRLSMHMLPAEK